MSDVVEKVIVKRIEPKRVFVQLVGIWMEIDSIQLTDDLIKNHNEFDYAMPENIKNVRIEARDGMVYDLSNVIVEVIDEVKDDE